MSLHWITTLWAARLHEQRTAAFHVENDGAATLIILWVVGMIGMLR